MYRLAKDGIVIYQSLLLQSINVPHAFGTRLGGVSSAPFDSLNLGNPGGGELQDSAQNIAENERRFLRAAGCEQRLPRKVRQVHGADVVRANADDSLTHASADALICADARCAVMVRVADCVPMLLASEDGRMVAAVHAGWRGVIAGVASAALNAMRRDGANPSRCLAAIGPCISQSAFEVGPEVLDEFIRVFGPGAAIRRRADGKGHVDLREALRRQLLDAGLSGDCIDLSDCCTFADRAEFFSHRREHGLTGRMAAVIAPVIASPRQAGASG